MAETSAASAAQPSSGIIGDFFRPIGSLLRKNLGVLFIILIVVILVLAGFVGVRYFSAKQETGQLASTVTHGTVAAEEGLSPVAKTVKKYSPELYAVLYPSKYNPYAIDSAVETTYEDIGVKITKFTPITDFFRPNSDIRLLANIKARSPGDPLSIEVYCNLEDYRNDAIIPAELTGTTAIGNTGTIFKDQTTEFIASCTFPGGLPADRQVTSKVAKLIVVYNFKTKAYLRTWFENRDELLSLQSRGIDPFEFYSVQDTLLDSKNKVRSKATKGPMNLGLQIDVPQPFTSGSRYLLLTQLSRTLEEGNMQKLDYLKVQVPSVQDLDVVLASEQNLGAGATCDFEYVLDTGNGYKEYQLLASKLEETNHDCDQRSLRELALSERDCIEFFKEPLFTCNFIATKVPATLQSDIISAEASYTFKVEKKRAVDIRALPSEVSSSNTAAT